ncbi:thioredoxin family protein [Algoriphagus jejuensis]
MEHVLGPITHDILKKGLTYPEFRILTEKLVAEGKTTGANQSEAYLEYTRLNHQRMKRWDKTLKISTEMTALVQSISEPQVWTVITEAWCGDGAQSIPFLAAVADLNPVIDFRILMRDEYPEVMDEYLTNGARSIPKLISMTADLTCELFIWGPKPDYLITRLKEYKHDAKGLSYQDYSTEVHLWYARNRNHDLEQELIPLIQSTLIV